MGEKIRIGALISGGGSNLQAIIDACENGNISGQCIFIGSDNPKADGLKRAAKYNMPSFVVDYPAIIRKFKEDPSKISLPGDFDVDELISKQSFVHGRSDSNRVKYFLTTRAIAEAKLLKRMEPYPFDSGLASGISRRRRIRRHFSLWL
jgi:phosphoribosylglycinamide formyltransferase-1